MRLEKISDTQIRCTLSKEDLMDRELRLSELAYGSEKAKNLFRDMMLQASCEFGFEAEDIPIMIEAIPLSNDSLVLVITKVEDPDELDTRFSQFSPDPNADIDEDEYFSDDENHDGSYADEILSCFEKLEEVLNLSKVPKNNEGFIPLSDSIGIIVDEESQKDTSKSNDETARLDLIKVYSFSTLEEIINLANIIRSFYNGKNTLYKNPLSTKYYLVTYKSSHTPKVYNKVCNIISEYGKIERTTYATISYFKEHFEVIVEEKALQTLSKL